VYFAKAINVDAEIRKRYNVFIKQHETKKATRKFTKSEVLITNNHGTLVIWGKLLEVPLM
jgi:mitochondrial fission protein ELM1